jgi:DNA mismatch repair ATPase MutS
MTALIAIMSQTGSFSSASLTTLSHFDGYFAGWELLMLLAKE